MRVRPFADNPEFRRLLAGERRIALARVALEIAADVYSGLDITAYLSRIAAISERVRARYPRSATVRDVLGQINWALYVEEELRGNEEDYYDPKNSYLNEVLDRRLGIPISLSLIYYTVAEWLGLDVGGVNLPLHFMLRVEDNDRTWFVDPFHHGTTMTRDECGRRLSQRIGEPIELDDEMVQPCGASVIITRMLRNLKTIHLRDEDLASLVPVQRRLAALNPMDAGEIRDLGVIALKAERPGDAIDPLSGFLETASADPLKPEITALFQAARHRLAEWN